MSYSSLLRELGARLQRAGGILLAGAACAQPRPPARDLVTAEAWTLAEDSQDPFRDARPDPFVCADWGYGAELDAFEVDTEVCDGGTFVQPALAPAWAGEPLRVKLWHDDLFAEQGGEAWLALGTGAQTWLELHLSLPRGGEVRDEEAVLVEDVAEGDLIWFHVQNHGANTYRLVAVRAGEEASVP